MYLFEQCMVEKWKRSSKLFSLFVSIMIDCMICLFQQVAKPNIGENHPASVRADVTLTLNLRPQVKAEWECKI